MYSSLSSVQGGGEGRGREEREEGAESDGNRKKWGEGRKKEVLIYPKSILTFSYVFISK